MQPKDAQRAISAARKLCKRHGITLDVIAGKGSHRGLIFTDDSTGEKVKIVLAGGKEISPGVQRGALEYLRTMADASRIAEVAKDILEAVFG